MIQRSLSIEKPLYDQLKHIASLEGKPIATIIRRALWEYERNYNFPDPLPFEFEEETEHPY